jgi:hypothetical protein
VLAGDSRPLSNDSRIIKKFILKYDYLISGIFSGIGIQNCISADMWLFSCDASVLVVCSWGSCQLIRVSCDL